MGGAVFLVVPSCVTCASAHFHSVMQTAQSALLLYEKIGVKRCYQWKFHDFLVSIVKISGYPVCSL